MGFGLGFGLGSGLGSGLGLGLEVVLLDLRSTPTTAREALGYVLGQ